MSGWTNFTSIAKSALTNAQKRIDTVLDIRENQQSENTPNASKSLGMNKLRDDFFSAFGLQPTSAESNVAEDKKNCDEVSVLKFSSSQQPHSSWSSWLNVETAAPTLLDSTDQESLPALETLETGDCKTPTLLDAVGDSCQSFLGHGSGQFQSVEGATLSPGVDVVLSTSSQLTLIDSDATFESFTNGEEPTSHRFKSSEYFPFEHLIPKTPHPSIQQAFESQQIKIARKIDDVEDIEAEVHECLDQILFAISPSSNSTSDEESLEEPAVINSKCLEDQSQLTVKGSGYSSPFDDMETNASSDIEVMSTPNGDNGSESSFRSGVVWNIAACENIQRKSKIVEPVDMNKAETEKRLNQLNKILEMREKRLMDLSAENVKLSVENEQLRRELRDYCQVKQGTSSSLEFDLNLMSKEKRKLEQRVEFLEKEMSTRIGVHQFQQVVTDKERQIEDLLKEGEKLALKELKCNNILKKLRETESENSKIIKKQKEKLEEMELLKDQLKNKEAQELKYDDAVTELRKIIEKQDKLVEKLHKENEDSEEKCLGYKNAMNNLNSENADCRRMLAEAHKDIEVLKSTFDESVKSNLETQLVNVKEENSLLLQKYTFEMESINSQYTDSLKNFQKSEEMHKDELKRMELKLQESELRNQQLLESTTNTTKPLLHQIESLHASVQNQQSNFERVEQSLFDKLVKAERDCAIFKEKEQSLRNAFDQYKFVCSKTDSELSMVRAEMVGLKCQLASIQRNLLEMQENRDQCKLSLEKETLQRLKDVEDLQKEKEILISQFEFEKNQMKTLAEQNLICANEKFVEQEKIVQLLRTELEQLKMSQLRHDSTLSNRISESSVFDCAHEDNISNELPTGSYANIMEHLRSKLQERERDVWICREELKSMQFSRDSLVASLSLLNSDKIQLEIYSRDYNEMKEEFTRTFFKKLNHNYEALLQIYGEKIEENDELKLDLMDVKAMYKQHIEEFVNSSVVN